MQIKNDRNYSDLAYLPSPPWSNIFVGTDGYPEKHQFTDRYYIGGGKYGEFKAVAIEFYGVKTKT